MALEFANNDLLVDITTGEKYGFDMRRRNESGNKLCSEKDCNHVAKFRGNGKGQGLYCISHLKNKYSAFGDYTKFKYRIGYCQNIDGRLGWRCNAPIMRWCMLETDHVNGIHADNYLDNFQCICSNCHSAKGSIMLNKSITEINAIMDSNRAQFDSPLDIYTTPNLLIKVRNMNIKELTKIFHAQKDMEDTEYEFQVKDPLGNVEYYQFDASEPQYVMANLKHLKERFGEYRYMGFVDFIPTFIK